MSGFIFTALLVLVATTSVFADDDWSFSPIDPKKINFNLPRYGLSSKKSSLGEYHGYSNVLLGGVQRKGHSGGNYLETLYSDPIIEIATPLPFYAFAMGYELNAIAKEAEKASAKGVIEQLADPQIDSAKVKKAYVDEVSSEISRSFVLKVMANVLDEETRYRNIPLTVPEGKMRAALTKVLGSDQLGEKAQQDLFLALKQKYASEDRKEPFFFKLSEEWPAFIAGNGYLYEGEEIKEEFPSTLQELKGLIYSRLEPWARRAARQEVVRQAVVYYNKEPGGPASGYPSTQELDTIWETEKDVIAKWVVANFSLTEIKIGDFSGQPKRSFAAGSPPGAGDPMILLCAMIFHDAFDPQWAKRQEAEGKKLWDLLTTQKISPTQFNEATFKFRRELPAELFPAAAAVMRGNALCKNMPIRIQRVNEQVDTRNQGDEFGPSRVSEEQANRIQFGVFAQSDMDQRKAVIPTNATVDSHGNFYRYFFESEDTSKHQQGYIDRKEKAGVRYSAEEKRQIGKVNTRVRRIFGERQLIRSTAYALSRLISDHYVIFGNTSPMTFDGIYGVHLLSGAKNPGEWISQIFDLNNQRLRTRYLEDTFMLR